MPQDPYAVLRALLRAEALRSSAPKPQPRPDPRERQQPPKDGDRG